MLRTILKPLSFVPALIMMYIIFSFSAQDGDVSGQLSYQASVKIIETADYIFNANLDYDQIDTWANKIDFITRKVAHVTEYFALAIAVAFPLYVYGMHGILLMFLAGLICVGFACGDEYHQSFVAGRSPQARDVCIDSIGIFFGIIVVRIIGWTGRKTVFKEKVKVKEKRPKKKLFGRRSKTAYYDKYGNYQPPQPDDRYYQDPGSGYRYDDRYDNRYNNPRGDYYEQPSSPRNYEYDSRNRAYDSREHGYDSYNRDYDSREHGYDSYNRDYDSRDRSYDSYNRDYDSRDRGYDSRNRDYYRQPSKPSYGNPEPDYRYNDHSENRNDGYYEQPSREPEYQTQNTRTWSKEEVEAGLHSENASHSSEKKVTNPNDPFWSPEQEIDFNSKPEYPERNYQETNDPYEHDWGFDHEENPSPEVPQQPESPYVPKEGTLPYENRNGSSAPDESSEHQNPIPPAAPRRKKKHEKDWFFDL